MLTEPRAAWSFKEFENAYVFVQDKLAAAMRANPHMRVHVDCGYHDLATPYYAAEHSFAHCRYRPSWRPKSSTATTRPGT